MVENYIMTTPIPSSNGISQIWKRNVVNIIISLENINRSDYSLENQDPTSE